jgi:3-oxoacyl-[acyl-carrier protein] reductase
MNPPNPKPVALITGGEGALALALVETLASRGFAVWHPGKQALDVTDPRSINRFLETIPAPSVLIQTAGICRDGLVQRLSEASWDQVMQVNLKGSFLVSQAVAQRMVLQQRGHIIHIGSFAGVVGTLGQANYAAAKAGLIGLTQSQAKEWGAANIQVNCVLPGWMDTQMTQSLAPSVRQKIFAEQTLGRGTTTEESAAFIAHLAVLKHISGQVFSLDSRIYATL